jgi:predicted hydrocarbon binding protein
VRWAEHVARLTDEECVPSSIRGILKGRDQMVDLGVEGGISAACLEQGCGLSSCDWEQGIMSGCHEHVFEPWVLYMERHFLVVCWTLRISIFSRIPSDT